MSARHYTLPYALSVEVPPCRFWANGLLIVQSFLLNPVASQWLRSNGRARDGTALSRGHSALRLF